MSAVLEQTAPLLRPMHEHDLSIVLEIEKRSYGFPWSLGVFSDCLRIGYSCWAVVYDRRPAGYGIMTVVAGESHILNLCIDPDYRRRGFASVLLHRLLATARDHYAATAFLEVRPTNEGAIGLYEGMGFKQVAVLRAYYPATQGREDALVFRKSLRAGD
jgi:ribosomal-protein-alanine N-acetyltransferase